MAEGVHDPENGHEGYFLTLACAFVRGHLLSDPRADARASLLSKPLGLLSEGELRDLIHLGRESGLPLHRFKRTAELPRVRRVLGVLRGIQPTSLLDVGSGRGAFLWPLVDAFPDLPVTASDVLDWRVRDIKLVHDGGVGLLSAVQMDATSMPFRDSSFDAVTMLEVLEHIPSAERALSEACRVAARFVVLSVPSRPDDNPEHVHLFGRQRLEDLLGEFGVASANFTYVLNHAVVVAQVGGGGT